MNAFNLYGAVRSHSGPSTTEFTFTGEQNDPNGLEYLRWRETTTLMAVEISARDIAKRTYFAAGVKLFNDFVKLGVSSGQVEDAQRTLRQLSMCLRYPNARGCGGTLTLELASMCDATKAAAGGVLAVSGLLIFGITAIESGSEVWWETIFGLGAHFLGLYAIAQSGCL